MSRYPSRVQFTQSACVHPQESGADDRRWSGLLPLAASWRQSATDWEELPSSPSGHRPRGQPAPGSDYCLSAPQSGARPPVAAGHIALRSSQRLFHPTRRSTLDSYCLPWEWLWLWLLPVPSQPALQCVRPGLATPCSGHRDRRGTNTQWRKHTYDFFLPYFHGPAYRAFPWTAVCQGRFD